MDGKGKGEFGAACLVVPVAGGDREADGRAGGGSEAGGTDVVAELASVR